MASDSVSTLRAVGNWLVVTGIDLGTTYSGYAYSFRSDFSMDPLKITSNDWSKDGVHRPEVKAPSVILLNKDQSFNSFGYRAQKIYEDLLDEPEEASQYYFIQNFKMQLYEKMDISLEMTIEDVYGKKVPAIIVFTEAIRFLKNHCLGVFNERDLKFTINDIFFVITVPAIWTDAAKQFMREASERAGIDNSQMILAYEPEAAALYCSLLPADQGITKFFQEHRKIMIVDLGGGTVDITVVKVIKKIDKLTYFEHVHKVDGGAWGGYHVNTKYERFLEDLFGKELMEEFKISNMSNYIEMMNDFEVEKKSLSDELKKVGVKISGELRGQYNLKHGKDIKQTLEEKFNDQIKVVGDKLKFDVDIFRSFFKECLQHIVNLIGKTCGFKGCEYPSAMILVGGFSDSNVVRKAIKEAFPAIKSVVSPVGAILSVLKGSVVFGHEPSIVTGRVCCKTIGVALHRPYNPAIHVQEKTFKLGGKIRVDDCFEKMFTVNEVVPLGQMKTIEVHDLLTDSQVQSRRKQPKSIEVYATQSDDPKYITDPGCILVGRITVKPPGGKWPEVVEGYIEMKPGGTEITVRYRDKQTGLITEGQIDFF
ncbi:heat shock 70 kDa protein 12A-like [Mytilus californianus]|uniref:heat shock 70 kDa protein 12A-like n=1 Tax=Mytilus californianus TaxID=6549 RepID=UPI0022474F35|nr:heat shock 70 kDa protein 12A-like [Mytilus californianus]